MSHNEIIQSHQVLALQELCFSIIKITYKNYVQHETMVNLHNCSKYVKHKEATHSTRHQPLATPGATQHLRL